METHTKKNRRASKLNQTGDHGILLFDTYDAKARKLIDSFRLAGRDIPAIVIRPNGFLPEEILSAYAYFQGDFAGSPIAKGSPLYFNEVQVPDFWQIRSEKNGAAVYNMNQKRASIRYLRADRSRLVSAVDWMDKDGQLQLTDHYNQYGMIEARTVYDERENAVIKTYFDAKGREVIVENLLTNAILLNEYEDGQVRTLSFAGKDDLVVYFLQKVGLDREPVYYTSLSLSMKVSRKLKQQNAQNVLFWSEPMKSDIPGNMKMILDGRIPSTGMIYVQNTEAYEKLMQTGADGNKVKPLGHVYPFVRRNRFSNHALICTASDNLEQVDFLIEQLPEIHFHILALTDMSSKLLQKERYDNVTLYPRADNKTVDMLFNKCDWYFDINHGRQILTAVERAFLHNQIIFGIEGCIHETQYICPEHICLPDEVVLIAIAVKTLMADKQIVEAEIRRQQTHAMSEDAQAYQNI